MPAFESIDLAYALPIDETSDEPIVSNVDLKLSRIDTSVSFVILPVSYIALNTTLISTHSVETILPLASSTSL